MMHEVLDGVLVVDGLRGVHLALTGYGMPVFLFSLE